jgi:hypothetical protein
LDGLVSSEPLVHFIREVVTGYITVKMLSDLDKDMIIQLYNFLFKYKNVLFVSDDTIELIRQVILDKHKDVQIYVLNPTMEDIFANNVYKLDIAGTLYFVPLWHSELYFDNNVIVKCQPELPDNVHIDENNDINVSLKVPLTFSLLTQDHLTFSLGKRNFQVALTKLRLRQCQTFVLRREGISRIIEDDIYKIEDRGDIIVRIFMYEPS